MISYEENISDKAEIKRDILKISLFLLLSLALMLFLSLFSYFKIKDESLGDFIGVIFGVTAGILSLMGLVAIFVSLNSQHKIEKCRELYWQMIDNSFNNYDIYEISKYIKRDIFNYSKIFSQEERILKNVIFISKVSILIVIITWSAFAGFTNFNIRGQIGIYISILVGVLVLAAFYFVIGQLGDIVKVGLLRNSHELLNLQNHSLLENEIEKVINLLTVDQLPQFNDYKSCPEVVSYKNPMEIRPSLLTAQYLKVSVTPEILLNRLRMLFEPELQNTITSDLNLNLTIPLCNIRVSLIKFAVDNAGEEILLDCEKKGSYNENTIFLDINEDKYNGGFKQSVDGWISDLSSDEQIKLATIKYHNHDDKINLDINQKIIYLPEGASNIKLTLRIDSIHDSNIKYKLYKRIEQLISPRENKDEKDVLMNIICPKRLRLNEVTLEYSFRIGSNSSTSVNAKFYTDNDWQISMN
jgi:hypothetical protein